MGIYTLNLKSTARTLTLPSPGVPGDGMNRSSAYHMRLPPRIALFDRFFDTRDHAF